MPNPNHDRLGRFAASAGGAAQAAATGTARAYRRANAKARAFERKHPVATRVIAATATAAIYVAPVVLPEIAGGAAAYTMARAAANRSRYAKAAARGLGQVPKATKLTRGAYRISKR